MRRKKGYDPDVKAAVLAALLAGQTSSHVSEKWKIPKGTVDAWRDRMKKGKANELASLASDDKQTIGALLADMLRANLQTLRMHAELARDPVWFKQQDVASLATYAGILSDKSIRLLEAMGESRAR